MPSLLRTLLGARVWPCVLLFATACTPPAPPLPVVSAFGARLQPGIFAHTVFIENQTQEELSQIEATFTVYGEREVVTVTRHWSYWKPGESKSFEVSTTGGEIQRAVMTGYARRGSPAQAVQLSADFTWRHDPAP